MALTSADRIFNNLLTLSVLVGFFFLIFSRLKKQTAKETFQQIKGLFGSEDGK